MSNEVKTEKKTPRKLPQRRYVGSRETLWYILYDISASFNISGSEDVFVSDIAKIPMNYIALVKNEPVPKAQQIVTDHIVIGFFIPDERFALFQDLHLQK